METTLKNKRGRMAGKVSRNKETEGEEVKRQLLLCKDLLEAVTFLIQPHNAAEEQLALYGPDTPHMILT